MSEVTASPPDVHHDGHGQPPYLAHHFEDIGQQRYAESLGMWAFLATEVLFFGALFTAYTVYRLKFNADFEEASARLNILIGALNTVVLLTSSLTMALAVHAAQTDNQRRLAWWLVLTAALGALFMVFKAREYYLDYRENLVPGLAFQEDEWTRGSTPVNPRHVQLFLVFYYFLTVLHAIHLTIGIGLMVVLVVLARRGRFAGGNFGPIEVSGLYWHFIDIVWIFLLPLLYLIGTHQWEQLADSALKLLPYFVR
jgi:cytochrome c oxidase subunit 3